MNGIDRTEAVTPHFLRNYFYMKNVKKSKCLLHLVVVCVSVWGHLVKVPINLTLPTLIVPLLLKISLIYITHVVVVFL